MMSTKPVGQKASESPEFPEEYHYFQILENTFAKACALVGVHRRYYRVAGDILCLEFAGNALEETLTRALSHLEILPPSPQPSMTICIWDSISTSTPMPPPLYDHANVSTGKDENTFLHYQLGADTFHFFHPKKDKALYWIRSPAQIPWWETVSPLRILLNQWFERKDRLILHASAVATSDGGCLLAGPAGSGKSTTALSCLFNGMRYAADDLLLASNDDEPMGYCLYSTAKLRRNTYSFLPHLAAYETRWKNSEPDKAVFFLSEAFEKTIVERFSIKAILLPQVVDAEETTWVPAKALDALKALAPSSIFLIPGAGRRKFEQMSRFVRKIPAYHLRLGRDHGRIPEVVSRLIGGE